MIESCIEKPGSSPFRLYWKNAFTQDNNGLKDWKNMQISEKERITIPNTTKNVVGHVDSKSANSKAMHDKFVGLTSHKSVDESLYVNSMKLLARYNDTEYEGIIAIDSRNGQNLQNSYESTKHGWKHQCGFSKNQESYLDSLDNSFETLHNHPNSSLPSRDDIKMLFIRKNQSASNIVCHDLTFYRIEKLKEHEDVVDFIDSVYLKTKKKFLDYSDSRIEYECSMALMNMLEKGGYIKYERR